MGSDDSTSTGNMDWSEIPLMMSIPARMPGTPYLTVAGVGHYCLNLGERSAERWLKTNKIAPIVPGHYDANEVHEALRAQAKPRKR